MIALVQEEMGKLHTSEGDILLTAEERADLRAAAMNDGPDKRKLVPRKLGRSGLVKTSTRWPGVFSGISGGGKNSQTGRGEKPFPTGRRRLLGKFCGSLKERYLALFLRLKIASPSLKSPMGAG